MDGSAGHRRRTLNDMLTRALPPKTESTSGLCSAQSVDRFLEFMRAVKTVPFGLRQRRLDILQRPQIIAPPDADVGALYRC